MSESTLRYIAVAAGLALVFFLLRPKADIEAKQARQLMASGALLIDVRTAGEFGRGHIEGAINIPVSALQAQLPKLAKGKPIIVYCQSGARSSRAAQTLKNAGFQQVHNLGSISNW
jgi:phage shock protein E